MLQPGQPAPFFALPDADMQTVSLQAFRDKHGVTIALLSDPEGEVCRRYGVLQDKQSEDGAWRECLIRSTFVIAKKGVIRHAAYDVKPRGLAAEVYDLVKRLRV